ncbi:tetraacyldisaccharide 4'-kinase [uncultured Muribaculum sp.]|uniref:tetraacyldisaccharide 4'-kinase n=1 Tax=uncultured Muribaculum sp. TaxID=1918613 RepID=UPI0026F10902|nr:tetraacyldisaccharide 4'-kinase [uncultured Muribaculum sp.]
MSRSKILDVLLLYPLSKIYGAVMTLRNKMFDAGILKQHEFDVPVIVVGNIAIGGTGKTPHTEYLIESLRYNYNIGVLSRGYKRRTKGFVLATHRSRPEDIGDESYQIFQKYGDDITVAVCEDRVKGIRQLLEINKDINLMILDDAFQHRYVKPAVSVVLTECNRPVFYDKLLPLGRLREPMSALNRADVVVVTKCTDDMKPMDCRIFKENLNLFPFQKLFFSKYAYGHLVSVFPESVTYIPYLDWLTENDSILTLTGVANPRPFVQHLRNYRAKVKMLRFPDHHAFTQSDMALLKKKFEELPGQRKFIVTTEKDAVRLSNNPYFPHALKSSIFYLPIKVEFMPQNEEEFEPTLRQLIRNIRLAKKANFKA